MTAAASGLYGFQGQQDFGHARPVRKRVPTPKKDPNTIIWVVVKIMAPFWIPIIRHLMFRVPQKRTIIFDNHPHDSYRVLTLGLGDAKAL